jgi:hypothetical protein
MSCGFTKELTSSQGAGLWSRSSCRVSSTVCSAKPSSRPWLFVCGSLGLLRHPGRRSRRRRPVGRPRGQHRCGATRQSWQGCRYTERPRGPLAQLGERRLCTAEVRGSTPLRSTTDLQVHDHPLPSGARLALRAAAGREAEMAEIVRHPKTLIEFMQMYATGEDCRQALFEHRWPQRLSCRRCGTRRPGICAVTASMRAPPATSTATGSIAGRSARTSSGAC